ncbi:pentapeptide repeat-containing protein [Streptomyces xanthochromogenes]|uniref:pentapeptide repeat-containing protein n=1 Tax=Streptomyces xanthochromogenes TaxID=67384 RepID=UPI003802351C
MWIVAPLALAVASALGWAIYSYAYDHFAQAAAHQTPPKPADVNDVLKATVTALTLVGAVLAGLYAYRKQLLAEGDAHRADASQLADRYTTAAGQLGHDQAAVRLAGVYALARLADDWQEQRQVCIDVLCAYLRMPYEPDRDAAAHRTGEGEVRQTIISVIRAHLRTPESATAWCSHNFDFTGAVFDGGDFSDSCFQGMFDFTGAVFSAGTVDFTDARFRDGEVTFAGAEFSGGTLTFHRTVFDSGFVRFDEAAVRDGMVSFAGARFSAGVVLSFHRAVLREGMVSFAGAEFRGGTVDFPGALFDGSRVDFVHARLITGTVNFAGVRFRGGTVDFSNARLSGTTLPFTNALFRGTTFDWGPLPAPTGA